MKTAVFGDLRQNAGNLALELLARDCIQRSERLVQQQDLSDPTRVRGRDRRAAAFRRKSHADNGLQSLPDPPNAQTRRTFDTFRRVQFCDFQTEGNILHDRQPRE